MEPVDSLLVASVTLDVRDLSLNWGWSLASVKSLLKVLRALLEASSILRVPSFSTLRVTVRGGELHTLWAFRGLLWHSSVGELSPAGGVVAHLVLEHLLLATTHPLLSHLVGL